MCEEDEKTLRYCEKQWAEERRVMMGKIHASQARLSEAVKVLEHLIEQAAHVCIGASTPMDIRDAAKKLHSPIVAAKAFLATLGEEND